ncbi:MAG TPA: extracellular solute-binding protein [Clostridia bacterium]|nr:extracellular solute-binding protein [Clostridia bacterium]
MREEKKDWFKNMTVREKVEYIWDYYKVHIIIGILVIYLLGTFTSSVLNRKEYVLNIAFVGKYMDFDRLNEFSKEVTKELVGDPSGKKQASIDFYRLVKGPNGNFTLDPASTQKLMARMGAQDIDVIILDKNNFDILASQGAFLRLDEVKELNLSGLNVAKVEEPSNEVKPGVYGIYVGWNNKYLKNLGYDYNDKIVAIISNSLHKELAIRFVKWLLNIK